MSTKQDREEARERLLEMLKPGDTVSCVLRHVSRSGMTRWIDLYAFSCEDGEVVKLWLSPLAAKATGHTFDSRRESIKIEGAGMDMGFALVYALSNSLWPNGFDCIGEDRGRRGCPSNDHSNRVPAAHHKDGGYALRHDWIS